MINLNEIPSTSDPISNRDRDQQHQHSGFYQCPLVSSSSSSLGNVAVGFYPPLLYQDKYKDDENCIATKRKKAKQKAPPPSSSSSCDLGNDFRSSRWNNKTPIVRVCSDCSTTKTPLWRSGPNGPKTLCNACGIRQRKARRAMVAVAAHEKAAVPVPASKMKEKKTMKKKRRCKWAIGSSSLKDMDGEKEESLEMVLRRLRKRLGIVDDEGNCERLVFHQEEEAAILLMAISSGLQFN